VRMLAATERAVQPPRWRVVAVTGLGQIFAWGSSYYLLAVLAGPIEADTHWPSVWVLGGFSLGLLASSLISPAVGRLIEHFGGRPVLAAATVALGLGVLVLGFAHGLASYIVAWLVLGLGMGAGLYDPAFATLGRLYGEEARGPITALTLYGGFASTICWPLAAWLNAELGWRGTCFAFAALQLGLILPAYCFGLPRESAKPFPFRRIARIDRIKTLQSHARPPLFELLAFGLMSMGFTLAAFTMTVVSVLLLSILQRLGLSLANAVALGALIGPAQVAARIGELLLGRRFHPIWTMAFSTLLVAVGFGLMLIGPAFAWLGIAVYGAGNGLRSIVRGTLPLAVFGSRGYAVLMGRLAVAPLLVQAASPSLGAILLNALGGYGALAVLLVATLLNFAIVLILAGVIRKLTRS